MIDITDLLRFSVHTVTVIVAAELIFEADGCLWCTRLSKMGGVVPGRFDTFPAPVGDPL